MGRRGKVDWGRVDWRLQDCEVALLSGCSRERVRQMRPKGVKPKNYRRRRGLTAAQRIAGMDTSGMEVGDVAHVAGCGVAYARTAIKAAGKGYVRKPKGNAKYDWSLLPSDWKDRSDKEMAVLVGAKSPAVVTQWRIRHGMRKRV